MQYLQSMPRIFTVDCNFLYLYLQFLSWIQYSWMSFHDDESASESRLILAQECEVCECQVRTIASLTPSRAEGRRFYMIIVRI